MPRFRWWRRFSPRSRAIRAADRLRDDGRPEAAAIRYRAILDRWGERPGMLVQLGNALKDSGAYGQADDAYERALALAPDDADIFLQRGHLMKLIGATERAAEFYAISHQLDPERGDARRELGNLMIDVPAASGHGAVPIPTASGGMSSRAELALWQILDRYRVRRT